MILIFATYHCSRGLPVHMFFLNPVQIYGRLAVYFRSLIFNRIFDRITSQNLVFILLLISFFALFVFIVHSLMVKLEVYLFLTWRDKNFITQNECIYCVFLVGGRKRHENLCVGGLTILCSFRCHIYIYFFFPKSN